MRPNCIEGTFGIEIDPMLEVDEKKDYVIRKRRYSGFFGTDLDLVLRENEVENVVVVGTKTNCCIRATVTDAFYLNYNPYVIRECVATNSETVNEVHLTDIDKYLGKVIDMNTFKQDAGRGTVVGGTDNESRCSDKRLCKYGSHYKNSNTCQSGIYITGYK